jgi:hypothetical protein
MTQTGVRTNIFGIGEVYELQREGLWVEKNRETYREYGYFGGGYRNPSPSIQYSLVERIDYSNDTATASRRASFPGTRRDWAATGNSNFGYFGGGVAGSSLAFRLDYSNDTSLLRVTFPNTGNARRSLAATGNSNFGYFGGGANTPSPERFSEVSRVDYSNDLAQALLRGTLSRTFTSGGN